MWNIASSIRGRLRVRLRPLPEAGSLETLCAQLRAQPGVGDVQSNSRTGSVLIHYDPLVVSPAGLDVCLVELLGSADEGPVPVTRAGTLVKNVWRQVPAVSRRDLNRYAKYGAVACMALSLWALAIRQRRLHVWGGVASLAFTGVHMAINRRNLWR